MGLASINGESPPVIRPLQTITKSSSAMSLGKIMVSDSILNFIRASPVEIT
jgi:hypothetical protein